MSRIPSAARGRRHPDLRGLARGPALGRLDRRPARHQGGRPHPRRGSLRPGEDQGAHPRVPRGAHPGRRDPQPDPRLRRTSRRGQDPPGQEHRQGDGPQVRADEPGRHPRRGRDPRPSAHVHRRPARPDHPEHQDGGVQQPGVHARRGRQDRHGLPGRPELRRCSRSSTRSRTTPSRTTTWRCRSTCPRCSSWPPPTCSIRSRPPCATGWRSSSLPGYTEPEKIEIGKRFLIPKQMANHGLKDKHIEITDGAMTELVRSYTHEAGVRNLERELANVMRKTARQVAEGRKRKTVVDAKKLADLLGPQRFEYGELEPEDQVGSATGLVVTEVGGDVVAIEVTKMEGREDFILTGQLGEVMRESARAGLSWTRAHARELGIPREVFETNTLHIHVPAGAIPKDGPSAGITMALAIVSALTGIPVRKDVAMTGEITLRGRVLPSAGSRARSWPPTCRAPRWSSCRARTRRTCGTSPRRSASRSSSSSSTRWSRCSRRPSGASRSPSSPSRPRSSRAAIPSTRARRPAAGATIGLPADRPATGRRPRGRLSQPGLPASARQGGGLPPGEPHGLQGLLRRPGRPQDSVAGRHQEGLPQGRPEASPGHQPGRCGGRARVQGRQRGQRRPVRSREARAVRPAGQGLGGLRQGRRHGRCWAAGGGAGGPFAGFGGTGPRRRPLRVPHGRRGAAISATSSTPSSAATWPAIRRRPARAADAVRPAGRPSRTSWPAWA